MEQKALLDYKQELLVKQDELSPRILRRESIHIEQFADAMDNTTNTNERDIAVISLGTDANILRQIIQALARIDKGEFGICQECDEPISGKRLNSVPWALYCTACAEIKERQLAEGEGQGCASGLRFFASLHAMENRTQTEPKKGAVTSAAQQAPPPRPEPNDVFHRIYIQSSYHGAVYPSQEYLHSQELKEASTRAAGGHNQKKMEGGARKRCSR